MAGSPQVSGRRGVHDETYRGGERRLRDGNGGRLRRRWLGEGAISHAAASTRQTSALARHGKHAARCRSVRRPLGAAPALAAVVVRARPWPLGSTGPEPPALRVCRIGGVSRPAWPGSGRVPGHSITILCDIHMAALLQIDTNRMSAARPGTRPGPDRAREL